MKRSLAVIVAARNEADRVGETVAALRGAFPDAAIWVADDASEDGTAELALAAGAQVVSRGKPHGKGANVTAAAEAALGVEPAPALFLLCDGDLGASAARLTPLVEAVERESATLRWPPSRAASAAASGSRSASPPGDARLCDAETEAPISGQRALRAEALRARPPGPRLRDGDRDHRRRGARRLPARRA